MGEMACKDLPERQVSVDIFPTVHETKLGYHNWKTKTPKVVFMIITMTITTILTTAMTITVTMKLTIAGLQCHAIQTRSK